MSYIIYTSSGSVAVIIPEGMVESESTSLDLIGKNLDNYGEYFNSNFYKLLTNFASDTDNEPRSPKVGQIWFDTTANRLKIFNGTNFVIPIGTQIAGTQPETTSTGELWYDTINGQLKLWDGNSYQLIAPAISKLYGKFGIEPGIDVLSDDQNIPQKIGLMYSYSSPVMLLTTSSFVMKTVDAEKYLYSNTTTYVVNGTTIINDLEVKGNLFLRGSINTPLKFFTTVYDITQYGDVEDPLATTSTIQSRIDEANNAIRFDMRKLFPVETISTLSQTSFVLGSELRVLCTYNTSTSVRRFILEDRLGPYDWEPYNLYYNTWTTVNNNIII